MVLELGLSRGIQGPVPGAVWIKGATKAMIKMIGKPLVNLGNKESNFLRGELKSDDNEGV